MNGNRKLSFDLIRQFASSLADLKEGSLNVSSVIRPNKLVTANNSIIKYKAGSLKTEKLKEVIEMVIKIFKE